MNFESDDEIPGSSQNAVERGERGLLKDFIPVLVFNQRTLERMNKMEGLRRQGVAVHYWAVCTNCPIALTIEQLLLLWSNCSIVRALWLKFSFCSISFFSKSKSSMPKFFFGQLHQVCPSKMVTHAFQMGHLGSLKKIKKK